MLFLENRCVLYTTIQIRIQTGETPWVEHISALFLAFLSNLQTISHIETHEKQHPLCSRLANRSTLYLLLNCSWNWRFWILFVPKYAQQVNIPIANAYRQRHNSYSVMSSALETAEREIIILMMSVCLQAGALVLGLVLCCHTVIHIIFLKPLYVPNILPQISVVWENLDIYLL